MYPHTPSVITARPVRAARNPDLGDSSRPLPVLCCEKKPQSASGRTRANVSEISYARSRGATRTAGPKSESEKKKPNWPNKANPQHLPPSHTTAISRPRSLNPEPHTGKASDRQFRFLFFLFFLCLPSVSQSQPCLPAQASMYVVPPSLSLADDDDSGAGEELPAMGNPLSCGASSDRRAQDPRWDGRV